MDIIPIDNDLLSMETKDAFHSLYLEDDLTILKSLAMALVKLQVLYGQAPSLDLLGQHSLSLLELLMEQQKLSPIPEAPSQISRIIVVDRTVDLTSLFVTPLTYEALIKEVGFISLVKV